ncbi:MAG TPA: cytochrome c [Gammaproteobacteria bacterium]
MRRAVSSRFRAPVLAALLAAAGGLSAQERAPAPAADAARPDDVERGRELYVRFGCYACHLYSGAGYSGVPGGATLVPMRLSRAAFTTYLRNPPLPTRMPPYTADVLSDEDAGAIHAFIRSLPQTDPGKPIPALDAIVDEIRRGRGEGR